MAGCDRTPRKAHAVPKQTTAERINEEQNSIPCQIKRSNLHKAECSSKRAKRTGALSSQEECSTMPTGCSAGSSPEHRCKGLIASSDEQKKFLPARESDESHRVVCVVKRKCEEENESSTQKVAKTAFQSSETETFQMQSGCTTSSKTFKHHHEDLHNASAEKSNLPAVTEPANIPRAVRISPAGRDSANAGCSKDSATCEGQNKVVDGKKNFQTVLETFRIPEGTSISHVYSDSEAKSKAIVSITKVTYGNGHIDVMSVTGSDHVEDSESHSNVANESEINPFPLYDSKITGKDKGLESAVALLSEQIRLLQASKLELLKNYEQMYEKCEELQESKFQLLKKYGEACECYEEMQSSKLKVLANYRFVCEKNKLLLSAKSKLSRDNKVLGKKIEELNEQLSDKEKRIVELEDDLQNCVVKITHEVKLELFEKFEEDLSCNICTDLLNKPVVLECSHSFCTDCILRWTREKDECPLCRFTVTNFIGVRALERVVDKTLSILSLDQAAA